MRFSNDIGFYELNPFPSCNQLIVFNHAFVKPEHRGQGYGRMFHEERLRMATELGYDYALCTVRMDNEIQLKILDRYGWTKLAEFTNQETQHQVGIYGKPLQEQQQNQEQQ